MSTTTTFVTTDQILEALRLYDVGMRAGRSTDEASGGWDTIRAVADCDHGMWGAFGEFYDVLGGQNLLGPDGEIPFGAQEIFEAYQTALGHELEREQETT